MKNINETVSTIAEEYGFKGVYFLQTEPSCVKSNECLVLLLYPYAIYADETYVPAYYVASNESYHRVKSVVDRLNDLEIRTEQLNLSNVKAVAEQARIGLRGRNTLLHTKRWGSRVVLYTLRVIGAVACEYDEVPLDSCKSCKACIMACPSGAISDEGYCREKCIRNYMEDVPYPDWVKKKIRTYLGCEVCMNVCPYNKDVPKIDIPCDVMCALLPDKILAEDVKMAKKFMGQNISKRRLIADAEAILKNDIK